MPELEFLQNVFGVASKGQLLTLEDRQAKRHLDSGAAIIAGSPKPQVAPIAAPAKAEAPKAEAPDLSGTKADLTKIADENNVDISGLKTKTAIKAAIKVDLGL